MAESAVLTFGGELVILGPGAVAPVARRAGERYAGVDRLHVQRTQLVHLALTHRAVHKPAPKRVHKTSAQISTV